MQRQFHLFCKLITDIQPAFEGSSSYVATTETSYYKMVLTQPAEGSEKLKPLQCPNCGTWLKVTIRSETDVKKRAKFIWTAFGFCWLLAIVLFILVRNADSVYYFLIPIIPAALSGFLGYFGLPSQLRATLYDADGNIIIDETEHGLSEIRSHD
jgi:hypothetical protein